VVWQSRLPRLFRWRSAGSRHRHRQSHPELIEAAKQKGKIVWYTSVELELAEKVAKRSRRNIRIPVAGRALGRRAAFPGLSQNIPATSTKPISHSSDARISSSGNAKGLARPLRPDDVAQYYPPEQGSRRHLMHSGE